MSDHSDQSDQVSRYEDLERTDVLPQLRFDAESADENDVNATAMLVQPRAIHAADSQPAHREAIAPYGASSQKSTGNGALHTLPSKPSPTDLAVGGIRGKIADLESKLIEAQDHQTDLDRHCEQLTQRFHASEARASKAEANYVVQASDLYRTSQRASEAEQRLAEQRVQLEAQMVDIERQLLDVRMRADKRTATLEQLLAEQTERALQNDGALADARIEMERLRAEFATKQVAIQGLEERLANQTQTAAEVSRLYAHQTSQVSSITATAESDQKRVAELQAAKDEDDRQMLVLKQQVQSAAEAATKLQSDIDTQRRHINALEQGLVSRDRIIDELKTHQAAQERAYEELNAVKLELDGRYADLQKVLADSQIAATEHQDSAARLSSAVKSNESQIEAMLALQRSTEQIVHDRDAVIAEAADRMRVAQDELARTIEQLNMLRTRLDKQQVDIDDLQSRLQTRNTELETARGLVLALQQQKSELHASMDMRVTEFDSLQKTTQKLMAERDQLESENQAGRVELARTQMRYDEAVQTILASRESISVREQQNASLERELRAVGLRLAEAQARIDGASTNAAMFDVELRERDTRIAMLEQKLIEHVTALNAIEQDIERVNSVSPNEKLAAMGYALESLDTPGVVHRLTRMTTTAGRSSSSDIEINSTSVSRYHARIVVKPEGVWLIDLQSTNGCGVNGRRASRQILCDGDVVRIGHCMFRFSALGAESSESVRLNDLRPTNSVSDPVLLSEAGQIVPTSNNNESRVHH